MIPIKKRIDLDTKALFYEAYAHLMRWYDDRPQEFHEVFRLRPKIESFFSVLKRVADGYCWSRGRPRKDAKGRRIQNADSPYTVNYCTDNFFPPIPDADKLIAA